MPAPEAVGAAVVVAALGLCEAALLDGVCVVVAVSVATDDVVAAADEVGVAVSVVSVVNVLAAAEETAVEVAVAVAVAMLGSDEDSDEVAEEEAVEVYTLATEEM